MKVWWYRSQAGVYCGNHCLPSR